jgi:hypothetical protein
LTNYNPCDILKSSRERKENLMKKSEIFATIKSANQIVDQMAGLDISSKEYTELNEALGWTLDSLVGVRGVSLHLSKRTGHYYVKLS